MRKITKAQLASGFGPRKFIKIMANISPELIERVTAGELALIVRACNTAWTQGCMGVDYKKDEVQA